MSQLLAMSDPWRKVGLMIACLLYIVVTAMARSVNFGAERARLVTFHRSCGDVTVRMLS
jgi:hypothetical protein